MSKLYSGLSGSTRVFWVSGDEVPTGVTDIRLVNSNHTDVIWAWDGNSFPFSGSIDNRVSTVTMTGVTWSLSSNGVGSNDLILTYSASLSGAGSFWFTLHNVYAPPRGVFRIRLTEQTETVGGAGAQRIHYFSIGNAVTGSSGSFWTGGSLGSDNGESYSYLGRITTGTYFATNTKSKTAATFGTKPGMLFETTYMLPVTQSATASVSSTTQVTYPGNSTLGYWTWENGDMTITPTGFSGIRFNRIWFGIELQATTSGRVAIREIELLRHPLDR